LRITPQRDSKELDLALTIEALSLPGAAAREQLESSGPSRLAGATLESLAQPILERNLFAPPNQPPALATISTQRAEAQKPISLTVQATDPDKNDRVSYALKADGIQGASLDPQSGRLSWTPAAPGTYKLTVEAWDDGIPARNTSRTFEVVVTDPSPAGPPPPMPRPFDLQFTYLTAITEARGEREAWISIRTTGELVKLREGDEFSVKGFEGTVREIRENAMIYSAGGKQYTVALGNHFEQSTEASPSQAKVSSAPVDVARP
jgi:hypothetical protein